MNYRLLLPIPLLFLSCACMQDAKATFTVEVQNISTTPISVALTKNGPPKEDHWYAPEDLPPALADRHWGMLVRPGQTVTLGPQLGHFRENVAAVLRVYSGNPTVEEALAYGRKDPGRLDIVLWEGKSSYVINDPGGGPLVATPADNFPKATPPQR